MSTIKTVFYMILLAFFSLSCTAREDNQNHQIKIAIYPAHAGEVAGEASLKKGEEATISAKPIDGFVFDYWQIAGSGEVFSKEGQYTFKVSSDLDLIAVFRRTAENSLVNKAEQIEIPLIANYGNSTPENKLILTTRYIGDDFIENGISKEKSGVVNDKGNISMVINTKELEAKGLYTPITGGGPHMWLSKQFTEKSITPWSVDGQYISLSVKAAVPFVELTDPQGRVADNNFTAEQAPVTQLSFGLYFRDKVNGITFAYIIPMYESRGTYPETANAHDTFVSFVSSPLEAKSTYVTKAPMSATLQSKPYEEQKYFEVHLTKQNLEKAIRDSKENFSTDISKYELTMAGILFELPNYVKNGHNVTMLNLSDFNVKIDKN
ncbi:InlB B-repeat-containing protein [Sphingobacterium pedocola]|nr:hypothetical protein [Sphingobacterium pedocola]